MPAVPCEKEVPSLDRRHSHVKRIVHGLGRHHAPGQEGARQIPRSICKVQHTDAIERGQTPRRCLWISAARLEQDDARDEEIEAFPVAHSPLYREILV